MPFEPPQSLSPSSIGAFTSCPLSFRFGYVERLPEPPSAPASRGTLVHLALQHLHWRPAPERTLDAALADLERAAFEMADHPDIAGLGLSADDWRGFLADAEVLVRRYFDLEDPTQVHPIGLELRLEAEIAPGVKLRGVIDRLEIAPDGEWVVTDYKTGSAPGEGWEAGRLAGVHAYALMCERVFGRLPARVQLLYLSKPERIVAYPTANSVRGVEVKSGAVMQAVRTACERGDFRPRPGPLCEWCTFREFCPSYGGDPEQARPVLLARQAEAEGRPQLPLAAV